MSNHPDNSNVVDFTDHKFYKQPPHVAKKDLIGCEQCGDGFTFLLRADFTIACACCGHEPNASFWLKGVETEAA